MKNHSRSRKDVELLIVEAFHAARQAMDAFEQLAIAACSSKREEAERTSLAS